MSANIRNRPKAGFAKRRQPTRPRAKGTLKGHPLCRPQRATWLVLVTRLLLWEPPAARTLSGSQRPSVGRLQGIFAIFAIEISTNRSSRSIFSKKHALSRALFNDCSSSRICSTLAQQMPRLKLAAFSRPVCGDDLLFSPPVHSGWAHTIEWPVWLWQQGSS